MSAGVAPAALTRTVEDGAVSGQVAEACAVAELPGQYVRFDATDKPHQLAATVAGRIYNCLGA